ncbi:MAG: dihydrofolate reductase [Bacteroidales bacterium]|nr:dihydrofolate reductase [Bacteroidales bacterium]
MNRISIIVAVADNNAIGNENRLLWHIPADLKRFKALTTNHTVLMGKNTWESLPIKPLPNRTNVVLTDRSDERIEGVVCIHSFDEALKICASEEETFIMGGGMVYRQFLPHAHRIYLTRVYATFVADTFFPEINMEEWDIAKTEHNDPDASNPYSFSYLILDRKKK